jgi:hypothetical protein
MLVKNNLQRLGLTARTPGWAVRPVCRSEIFACLDAANTHAKNWIFGESSLYSVQRVYLRALSELPFRRLQIELVLDFAGFSPLI